MDEQANASADRADAARDIGLAVVKALTELDGGTVSARSGGIGRGSEVVAGFPLRAAREFVAEPRGPRG